MHHLTRNPKEGGGVESQIKEKEEGIGEGEEEQEVRQQCGPQHPTVSRILTEGG
jgi:hypothetical protein